MTTFILGLIIFFGSHLFTSFARAPRAALIAKMGEGPYKGLYSLVSLIGLVLIVRGWPEADRTVLYVLPYFVVHITYLLVLIALILVVAAYAPAGYIAEKTKHPMLAGVKVWAFAHLLVNGDVRSLMLFGSFLAYAVIDRIAVKKRGEMGRASKGWQNDLIAVIIGLVAYGLIFRFHGSIAGVALVPAWG